ncbi:hypothetical protein PHMEG_00013739 [Phytophthora megakarya]|uniref:Uncharacterized protein n=1 Tax=Phytophthora megakarya TaxID=4795 RepID=A0A225W5J7_9STRA|nr:hypothetical protein PHMEG_00013739 [Phytophthora megakarya]
MDGRCLKWAVNLSPWDLGIRWVENDQDGLAAILGAGITPPGSASMKTPKPWFRKRVPESSHRQSSWKCSLVTTSGTYFSMELPRETAEIVAATGHVLEKATVNEAEYARLVKDM